MKILSSISLLLCMGLLSIPNMSLAASPAANCKTHPLYCRIIQLNPQVNKSWAMQLSNKLAKYGRQHKQDPYRSLAIAMQESTLKMINRKDPIIVFNKKCTDTGTCTKSYKIIHGVTDVGLFQFHVKTIVAYKLDPVRLQTDLDYSVSTHFKVLRDKLKQCRTLKHDAWSCYHSKTPSLRKLYAKKVNHYYQQIKPTKNTKKKYRTTQVTKKNHGIKLPEPTSTLSANLPQ